MNHAFCLCLYTLFTSFVCSSCSAPVKTHHTETLATSPHGSAGCSLGREFRGIGGSRGANSSMRWGLRYKK